jgi:hypothetical protein
MASLFVALMASAENVAQMRYTNSDGILVQKG